MWIRLSQTVITLTAPGDASASNPIALHCVDAIHLERPHHRCSILVIVAKPGLLSPGIACCHPLGRAYDAAGIKIVVWVGVIWVMKCAWSRFVAPKSAKRR